MRRISTASSLSPLCCSFPSAQRQQASNKEQPNPKQNSSPVRIDGPVIGGDGTANYIPIWRTTNYLQSSVIYQAGAS